MAKLTTKARAKARPRALDINRYLLVATDLAGAVHRLAAAIEVYNTPRPLSLGGQFGIPHQQLGQFSGQNTQSVMLGGQNGKANQ